MRLLTAFAVCLVSAIFPLINAEAYVGALAAVDGGSHVWAIALAAGSGQTCGKVIYYLTGRGSREWRWTRRRKASPKWQARAERWELRIQHRRWTAAAVLAVSAVVGLPPLAILSVIAGRMRFSLPIFVAVVFVGRTLRFAALFAGVAALDLT
jgi:membrane protein YqaA with SNARE-associated domain